MSRPLIAIPARFSASASALRHRALVTARALSQAVYDAGGEPLAVHPVAPAGGAAGEIAQRLSFADGLLLPGGGDLAPHTYGDEDTHGEVYDVDAEQDGFDLAVARWAMSAGVPTLAVCRGTQVVNVVLGGRLEQHMDEPHRPVVQDVAVTEPRLAAVVGAAVVRASCYHHQRLATLGRGLVAAACAPDGTVEAVVHESRDGWFLGVQWHPEDTAAADPAQAAVFRAFVDEAAAHRARR